MADQEAVNTRGTSQWKYFLREVKTELKKVTWPTRQELVAYTAVVFVAVIIVSSLIWGIDTLFNVLFRWIMKA